MKMKKLLALLLAMCLAFAMITGCSKTEEKEETKTEEKADEKADEKANEKADVKEDAKDDEKEIEKVISDYLDSAFEEMLDEDAIVEQYAGEAIAGMPEEFAGVFEDAARDFASKAFDKFEYKVSDIEVDGDKATAEVTLVVPDMTNVDMDFENMDPTEILTEEEIEEMMNIAEDDVDSQVDFIEKMMTRLFDKMLDEMDVEETTETVELEKDGDEWVLIEE